MSGPQARAAGRAAARAASDAGSRPAAAAAGAGPWLGVDLGLSRIGLSLSDRSLALAMPLATYPRGGLGELALAEWLAQVMQEHEASRVVIGVPLNMNGSAGPRAAHAQGVADALAARGVAVTLQDERLSTVEAEAHLRRAGRRAKNQRAVVDQAAAVIILQAALDAHRNVTKR